MKQTSMPVTPLIPAWAKHVLIIEPSGHLDWDWQGTFEQYYNPGAGSHTAVKVSFQHALELLADNPSYTYSICEQAYLQRFLRDFPSDTATIRGYGQRVSISGGGITSAENLLCHGETFIRNYLEGRHWVRDTLGVSEVPNLWIPDDFGHDSQLPVTLRAMGYSGAAFWRIPGGDSKSGESYRTAAAPASVLQQNIDFRWSGSDGSAIQAHWLWQSYCEGNNDLGNDTPPLVAIQTMVTANLPGASTPYMFVPIDCDFNDPAGVSGIIQGVEDWNNTKGQYGQATGVFAVLGPYTLFANLVAQAAKATPLLSFSGPFNPYFSGCYVTHPDLKINHYAATRALLAAEVFERVATLATGIKTAAPFRAAIADAWRALIPSSHHDYIVGTATDAVTNGEQRPQLARAVQLATDALSDVSQSIAGGVGGSPGDWVVFNALSFERTDVVLAASASFMATVPAFGYAKVTPPSTPPASTVSLTSSNGGWLLVNDYVRATFDGSGNLLSVFDIVGNAEVLSASSSAPGNQVVFYEDSGNIYRFGNEIFADEALNERVFQPVNTSATTPVVTTVDGGPLSQGLTVTVSYQPDKATAAVDYSMTYTLHAGEAYLRMSLTGAAPSSTNSEVGFSVMVRFPLSASVAAITHGTACHFTTGKPRSFYKAAAYHEKQQQVTFEPTHDFVLPQDASGNTLAAIYHTSSPAWGIDPSGWLLGCVLRNAYGGYGNAIEGEGNDTGTYTITYALRVPSGLGAASTGQPLREAHAYQSPLFGVPVSPSTGAYPDTLSLASTASPYTVVTAAKAAADDPAKTVFRVYQPNKVDTVPPSVRAIDASLVLNPILLSADATADGINAIEMGDDPDLSLTLTSTGVDLKTNYALSTVRIGKGSRHA